MRMHCANGLPLQGHMLQNYDGSSTYGSLWHWAGADNAHMGPLRSPHEFPRSLGLKPRRDLRRFYAEAGRQAAARDPLGLAQRSAGSPRPRAVARAHSDPQRRTFLSPTTEGDQRNLWSQGRPMAKDSSGSGQNWDVGTISQPQNGSMVNVESRLDFTGTVTATDMDRATDVREKERIGIFGTGLSYAGSYGRVTSETIGRDLNPLGRGDGGAYVAGNSDLGLLAPTQPYSQTRPGYGNSINNAPAAEIVDWACYYKWQADLHHSIQAFNPNSCRHAPTCASCSTYCSGFKWSYTHYAVDCAADYCAWRKRRSSCGYCHFPWYDFGKDCRPCVNCEVYESCHPFSTDNSSPESNKSASSTRGPNVGASCGLGGQLAGLPLATQVAKIATRACNAVLNKIGTLPTQVQTCLRNICSGAAPLNIICLFNNPDKVNIMQASFTGNPCHTKNLNTRSISINIFKLRETAFRMPTRWAHEYTHAFIHELFHVCDCRYTSRNSVPSDADCRLKTRPVDVDKKDYREAHEAYAEACANYIAGGTGALDPYRFETGGTQQNWCARCAKCY